MVDPKAVILEFLGALPITIREHVLAVCLMGFSAYPMDRDAPDLLELVSALMRADPPVIEGYKCAMVASTIEVALAKSGFDHAKMYGELNAQTGSKTFSTLAAQLPLKERHSDAARATFAKLRRGPLSPLALRRWSEIRLGSTQ